MIKYLKVFIPNFLKPFLVKLYLLPIDLLDRVKGKNKMIPPRSMIFIGAGDFIQIGEEFKSYFIKYCNLKPNHRILDVGCGIGRVAIPLTSFLQSEGRYEGFDIVNAGIKWCKRHISSKFANFNFIHSNVYNKHYNPSGKLKAHQFKFPYEQGFFDFCFLTSVFTHMLPVDMENYLNEIHRVLRPNGRFLFTFFLLNDESEKLINSGQSSLNFKLNLNGCKTTNPEDPETAIAFPEVYIINLLENIGFEIASPIHYGSWCNREKYLSYQDIIIGMKKP